jgi:hypothetical protein
MRHRVSACWLAGALVSAMLLHPSVAEAKETGVHSPNGKRIYTPSERFGEVLDQNRRRWVIEAVVGHGPEGNLGLSLGRLNVGVRGLELYAGVGYAFTPARQFTGSVRYLFNIYGFRPYLAAGYLLRDNYVLELFSHNVTGEAGYSWRIHHTYHLTAGVGARYILSTHLDAESPLTTAEIDPELLADQTSALDPWSLQAVLRLSRAF